MNLPIPTPPPSHEYGVTLRVIFLAQCKETVKQNKDLYNNQVIQHSAGTGRFTLMSCLPLRIQKINLNYLLPHQKQREMDSESMK